MREVYIELGTEVKLNMRVNSFDEFALGNYNFTVELFSNPRGPIVTYEYAKGDTNEDIKIIDEENFVVTLDTTELGVGKLYCKMTAYIPDTDFVDKLRTEIAVSKTNITIIKTI